MKNTAPPLAEHRRVQPPAFSARLHRLHNRFRCRYAELNGCGKRLFVEADEVARRDEAILRAYRATVGEPAIRRRARMLEEFAEGALIRLAPDDLLAGSQKFCSFGFPEAVGKELDSLGYAHNAGHIIHDYAGLLRLGVKGCLNRIHERGKRQCSRAQRVHLDAFERAMRAFQRFIERHAEAAQQLGGDGRCRAADLRWIAREPPRSFRQALQLAWFMQVFLHAENASAAISFGRLDQCLWPFLERDLATRAVTPAESRDLIGAFFIRCCEGEESQNLTVGGVDARGRDATNPLSILFLDVMRELRTFQPSLSVRVHARTPPELIRAACELAAVGTGQPGFINDAAAIPALRKLGIPLERARDFGIVGCYEAATQGDCYPNTVCGALTLPEILNRHLRGVAARNGDGFDHFLNGWMEAVADEYRRMLRKHAQPAWDHWRNHASSPFGSVVMQDCIGRAMPLEAGGSRFNLFGINILGLGTTLDGLHAIRTMVFDRRQISLSKLADAVETNFPDETLRQQLRSLPGRFGADHAATNTLAAKVSRQVAGLILRSRMKHGVRPYPAFFRFLADVGYREEATPDGRRKQENLSYGAGPSSAAMTTPTSVLASMRHVAHELCACGNPLAIALPRKDVKGAAGIARLATLVRTYFDGGGFHVHFNVVGPEELRQAKADPANHPDLTIRISGLSARYVTLTENIQDALIERAERGV